MVDEVVVGNPMAAVAKPKVPATAPKALQGENIRERLLESVAVGERHGWPSLGPSATSPSWPRPCSQDCAFSELLSLDLGYIDGQEGDRRLKVTGKGAKVRFVPSKARSSSSSTTTCLTRVTL